MKDALLLLGSALVALAVAVASFTVVMHAERPAAVVRQACVTTTAARG